MRIVTFFGGFTALFVAPAAGLVYLIASATIFLFSVQNVIHCSYGLNLSGLP